jgi:ribosomal protein S27AE
VRRRIRILVGEATRENRTPDLPLTRRLLFRLSYGGATSPWALLVKGFSARTVAPQVPHSFIFGNHGKAFIRVTRPVQGCVTGLPCPNCGSELAFLAQYQRQYCYACAQYAPEGFGERGAKVCPACGGILTYVAQYDRYYCYRDAAYPAETAVLESWQPFAPSASTSQPGTTETITVTEPAKQEKPKVATAEVPAESSPEPEEIVGEQAPEDEPKPSRERPPLVRREIFRANKTRLMDLCKAYALDSSGTREQIRQRLLGYLDDLEAETGPEETSEQITERTEDQPETSPSEEAPAAQIEPSPSTEETVQFEAVQEEARNEPPVTAFGRRRTPMAVESFPLEETFTEAARPAVAMVVPTAETQPAAATGPIVEPASTLHPCPKCGRELTYISLYRRWYCYSCRAYAPVTRSRFACPTCGAALRWIGQYERWWCDACRRYAPADLPKPESAVGATTTAAVVERPVSRVATFPSTSFVHRHASPGSGIGLAVFGVLLFVLYEMLVDLPAVLSFSTGVVVSDDLAFGLRFFAFFFLAVGVIMGLYAVRDRR